MMLANDFEYCWMKCSVCKEKVKIAKNKGNYWATFDSKWIEEFLLQHGGCSCGLVGNVEPSAITIFFD